jgi:outer membrane protein insertion porin family
MRRLPFIPRLARMGCAIALGLIAGLCQPVASWGQSPVQFSGATTFSQEELRKPMQDQLTEIAQRGLTTTRADDAAYYLAAFYRSKGYSRAEVNYQVRGNTLLLQISEGPRTVIRSLSFRGNRSFDAAALSPYVSGVQAAEIGKANLPYSEKELSEGADRVRAFYGSEGFLDVVVETKGTRVSPSGTAADLVISIQEGTRYTFGTVTFTPGTGFTDAALRDALGANPEGAFTAHTVDAMQRSLQSWLRGKGYYAVEVVAAWDKAKARSGKINVHFEVRRGAQFRINRITVRGTDRLRPDFMQQRFGDLRGEVYDPARVDEKYRELQRTGLFNRLRVAPKQTGPNTLDLEIEVEEAKQKEIGLELGYGSYDGMIAGIRLADRNLFGRGRPLSLKLEYSTRGFRGELLYIDPWFLESEWSMRARAYSEDRQERGYDKQGEGVRVDFARKRILRNALELNAVDNEIAFTRITARYSYYRAIGRSLVAFGLRGGWIIPAYSATDVPIDLRYFNGGGTTVRSFSERDLGPQDRHGNPIGGTFFTVANIEWNFPITGALDGALFADAGNLFNDEDPGLSDLRYAIGVGLRYKLPIGPLRIDYGYNPDRRAREDIGALHLSFGFAF